MKTIEAIELYNILQGLKLSNIPSSDAFNLILTMRDLREIVNKYTACRTLAEEQLKPDGYDDLINKSFEHNELIAGGGSPLMADQEIAELKKLSHAYNSAMKDILMGVYDKENNKIVGGIDSEPVEIDIKQIPKSVFDSILELNNGLTVGQISFLYDTIVTK